MKVAFQMDPIGTVDINADSSFRLAEEAQSRGHELFFYTPDHLAYQEGRITARGHDLTVQRVQGAHADLGPFREVDLSTFVDINPQVQSFVSDDIDLLKYVYLSTYLFESM